MNWLQRDYPIDSRSAWNISEYFRKQRDATGVIPNEKHMIVEGFRDEIGDPRIVIHSPFGRRVNGLLGIVAAYRIQQLLKTIPQMLYNDDGILLRCSDVDSLPLNFLEDLTVRETEEIVLTGLVSSPLFGGQFRQNAARALLMPKTAPGKRTPLWLQRLRAGDLLQITRQFDDFPIVIETMREVLNDVLDFNHFKEIVGRIESGNIHVESIQTEMPSPFAASMLFDFIAVYMYEWDQPREDRQTQYLSINRELLAEVVDTESMASLLRPEAVEMIEQQLQRKTDGYKARSPEELLEFLLRIGDLTDDEIKERCIGDGTEFIDALASNGRAVRFMIGNSGRWVAGEERLRYINVGDVQYTPGILLQYLQSHGPSTTNDIAGRYFLDAHTVETILTHLLGAGQIVHGRLDNNTNQLQWCYKPNLERIHRQTIGILRKEIKPSSLAEFSHFQFHWQHLITSHHDTGTTDLPSRLEQLQALPLPSEIWERDILRSRITGYDSESMNKISTGSIVWTGRGSGKMQCLIRGEGSVFLSQPTSEFETSLGAAALRTLNYIRTNGASFFTDIRGGTNLSLVALNNAMAELFWSGFITNDVFQELQNVKHSPRSKKETPIERIEMVDPRHNPHRPRFMRAVRKAIKQVPGWSGRWSVVHLPGVMGDDLTDEDRAHRQAQQLLSRYGIVAREFHRREELMPWPMIAAALQRMEMRGEIRRGYFVNELSGMQFALPDAVEELRRLRSEKNIESPPLLVNACDPANPYGMGIGLQGKGPSGEIRLTRIPSNYIVFQLGTPILMIENFGTRLWTLAETSEEIMRKALRIFMGVVQLPPQLRPVKSITIEHCDGIRPGVSPLEPMLRSLGFTRDRNQTMIYEKYV